MTDEPKLSENIIFLLIMQRKSATEALALLWIFGMADTSEIKRFPELLHRHAGAHAKPVAPICQQMDVLQADVLLMRDADHEIAV